jgi:hypothetical protein
VLQLREKIATESIAPGARREHTMALPLPTDGPGAGSASTSDVTDGDAE